MKNLENYDYLLENLSSQEITLRDWFAGQALASIDTSLHSAYIASRVYEIADAMMEERNDE